MNRKIIDIHPHIISTDTARYPMAPLGGHQSSWSQERPVSTEKLIAEMDAAGVDQAAVVQASTCYGFDNSYVADAVAQHPDRLTGVCSVDILAPDAVEFIDYWIGRGMSGLRLFTTGSTMPGQATWFTDERTFPAWKHVAAIGLPVCMQMTQSGIVDLKRILDRFPGVRIIVDHLAKPKLEDGPPYPGAAALFSLAEHPNVFLKLTIRTFDEMRNGKASAETFFPMLIEKFGASRIAWGSNYPAVAGPLKALVDLAETSLSCLSAEDRDWIFARTAERLYPALASAKKEVV